MPQFVQTEQQKELIRTLVQELPAYRKKMHMSQAELGDAVGKSRQKIKIHTIQIFFMVTSKVNSTIYYIDI